MFSGNGKTDSSVEFSKGMNIIVGPSDTGKTYVIEAINYILGAEKKSVFIDKNNSNYFYGYTQITADIETNDGQSGTFIRQINDNKIEVKGNFNNFENGKHTLEKFNNKILNLIGIDKQLKIIKNLDGERQKFSLRSIIRSFLLSEEEIIQKESIFTGKGYNATTLILYVLLYLFNGDTFPERKAQESKKEKEAKQKAITGYIEHFINDLNNRIEETKNDLKELDEKNINDEIDKRISQISNLEVQLKELENKGKELAKNSFELDNLLNEKLYLKERFEALDNQYQADLQRAEFIIEGENKLKINHLDKCPFCSSSLQEDTRQSYIEIANEEKNRVNILRKELSETLENLSDEIKTLKDNLAILEADKNVIAQKINLDILPQYYSLKNELDKYKQTLQFKEKIEVLTNIYDKMHTDKISKENESITNEQYSAKEDFNVKIVSKLNSIIDQILKAMNFTNYKKAYFDISSLDIVVNAKSKKSYGKGYRAFLNTILSISIIKLLTEYGKYNFKILAVDSPILSLKEKENKRENKSNDKKDSENNEFITKSMKESLFEYLKVNQNSFQSIIAENEIPNIDYSNVNIIRFTKDKSNGRYGLFLDVKN